MAVPYGGGDAHICSFLFGPCASKSGGFFDIGLNALFPAIKGWPAHEDFAKTLLRGRRRGQSYFFNESTPHICPHVLDDKTGLPLKAVLHS